MRVLIRIILYIIITLSLIILLLYCCGNSNCPAQEDQTYDNTQSGVIVKAQKYDYLGVDVMLVHVENRSDNNYMLTIDGYFYDSDGNLLTNETIKFDGFPSDYSNYFLFNPEMCFDSFEYELTTEIYQYKTLANYLELPSDFRSFIGDVQYNSSYTVPTAGDLTTNRSYEAMWCYLYPYINNYEKPLSISGYILMFDNKGELYLIEKVAPYAISNERFNASPAVLCYISDILSENDDQFIYPVNIENGTGLFALTWVGTY